MTAPAKWILWSKKLNCWRRLHYPDGGPEVEEIEALNVAPAEDSAHEPGKEPIGSGSPSPNFTTSSQPTERIDPLNHEAVQMSEGEPSGGASTLRRSTRTRRPPERLDL
uniref:Uncharacterized protein n=1 Tax=Trichuris muris TaxID=70415 RepID=A0A5S6QAQ0_TRIMR